MARSQETDKFHACKFHMKVVTSGVAGASNIGNQGGFTTLSLPEVTVEETEYKEGIYLYKRKYPGNPSFANISCADGVAKGNTDFYKWIRTCYLGAEYRVDLQIRHFHRTEAGAANNYIGIQPKRVINVFEAFASRVKPGADFDSNGTDISLEEMDITYEHYELEDTATPAGN